MAEGLLRHLGGDRFDVHSAGSIPSMVHPLAIRALAEIGIDAGGQRSKHWAVYRDAPPFDYIVAVCAPDEQYCPIMPARGRRLYWPTEDPIGAVGSEEERMAVFRRVRDEIAGRVKRFVQQVTEA